MYDCDSQFQRDQDSATRRRHMCIIISCPSIVNNVQDTSSQSVTEY